jgi:formylmethanofuran dehydrogenase subunit B
MTPLIRKNETLIKSTLEDAINKSATILSKASYPIVYGWSLTSCEAIKVGLELTEEIEGVMDNTSTICHGPSTLAVQEVGLVGCTLGQIRHRADLIIYWGSNPWNSHPRHMERYTSLSEGRFRKSTWKRLASRFRAESVKKKIFRIAELVYKDGFSTSSNSEKKVESQLFNNKERKMIVVDARKTRSADIADHFIQIEPGKDFEVLQTLRALINDEEIDVEEVGGISIEKLEEIADVMINCTFGVIFFGLGLTMSRGKHRNVETAIRLTQDLNKFTKFVIMPMRGHFNVTGTDTVFTWQTGFPYAVDFSHNYPRYNPGETSVVDILLRGDSDAALVVASDPVSNFPRDASCNLVKNPLIVIDPHFSPTASVADVIIPSAFSGIEVEGTTYRMDHVPLPLKKIVEPPEGCLSDKELLRMILKKVRELKMEK